MNYRDRIEIEEITGDPDEHGQIDLDDPDNWSTYIVRKAHRSDRGGREFYRGAQIQPEVMTQFRMYSDSHSREITSKMRVKFQGRIFEIISVTELDNKNRQIVLNCAEKQ